MSITILIQSKIILLQVARRHSAIERFKLITCEKIPPDIILSKEIETGGKKSLQDMTLGEYNASGMGIVNKDKH